MTIRITINTDNAAFEDDRDMEVCRILQAAARKIAVQGEYSFPLHDINGNKVGQVSVGRSR